MKEEKLDQILQQALAPEVDDNEIKVRFEKGEYPMRKKKNYVRPAVALVACAALVAGIGFGNLPDQILSSTGLYHKTDISAGKPSPNVEDGFVMKVKAAEVKELKRGETQAAIYSGGTTGEAWSGSNDNNEISYMIDLPLVCEGKNMDTITYSVNKGCFRILQPKNKPYVIKGEECEKPKQVSSGVDIEIEPDAADEKEAKYYKSFTISAKDQNRKDVEVAICDEKKLSRELYKQLWDNNTAGTTDEEIIAEADVKNEVMDSPQVTCKINYRGNAQQKTETAKVAVHLEAMTYKEAAGRCSDKALKKKLEQMKDNMEIFVAFERL